MPFEIKKRNCLRKMNMKKRQQYKAVFRTRIDFQDDEEPFQSLHPGRFYYLNNERKVSYSDIANEVERIINDDLKNELQKYTNLFIREVQMQSIYEGSIEIIFTVVLSFLDLIGGLKDLYDAVHLIKEIAERHIDKKLSDKFGNYFRVDTYVIAPKEEEYWYFEKSHMMNQQGSSGEVERDAFFYYLLLANIVLLLIVGVLVFGAVKAMYF